MNSGTRTMAPVSILAGLLPPVAVSPRTPGSVSMTLSSMCGGGGRTSGQPSHSGEAETLADDVGWRRPAQRRPVPQRRDADRAVLEPLRRLADGRLARLQLLVVLGV